MTARPLGGTEIAAGMREQAARIVSTLAGAGGTVKLAVVLATGDKPAAWYVRSLARTAGTLGIKCEITQLAGLASGRPTADDVGGGGRSGQRCALTSR